MNTAAEVSSFGTEKLSKLMLKFSIPCVLSLLVSALYNIVDQIFIGNSELSTLGNAATGVVFPFFIIAQAFAWCFGDGCAAYLNICLGKKDMQSADKAIGTGVTVTLLTSLLLIAVGYPLKAPLLTLFGASENSLGMAIEYLDVILAFFPFFMLSNMMNSVIRADGSPACSMASMLAGAVVEHRAGPAVYFRLPLGDGRRGVGDGSRTACLVSHLRLVFLPHQDLSAASAQLSPRFSRLCRRAEAGDFVLHHADDDSGYRSCQQPNRWFATAPCRSTGWTSPSR